MSKRVRSVYKSCLKVRSCCIINNRNKNKSEQAQASRQKIDFFVVFMIISKSRLISITKQKTKVYIIKVSNIIKNGEL
jgi:hypothetical protein